MAPESGLERHVRWMGRMLDAKGVPTFPADRGHPGWSDERFEQARRDLREAIELLERERSIQVSEDDAGTIRVADLAKLN